MEMPNVLIYLLKSTIAFTALYGLYLLLFRKNQQFVISRFYLVFTIVFAFLFPFIKIISYKTVEIPSIETGIPEMKDIGQNIAANESNISFWNQVNLSNIALYLYLIVSSIILIRLLYMLIRFTLKITKHSRFETLNGKKVIVSDSWNQTFSFFGIIVLPEKDFILKENQLLVMHELVHVKQYHSLDLLLAELFQVIHWFNPLAYHIKKDMREVHEFLADYSVVNDGVSKYAYQQLLLNYLVNSVTPRVANSFSAKLLKKRFAMMTNNKTPKSLLFKYLLAIPVIAMLVGLMSFQTEVKYTYTPINNTDKIAAVENISSDIIDDNVFNKSEILELKNTKSESNNVLEKTKNEPIPNRIELLNQTNIIPSKSKEIQSINNKNPEDLISKLHGIINDNKDTYLKDFLINSGSIPVVLKQGVTYRFYVVWTSENSNLENSLVLTTENKEKVVEVVEPIKTFKDKDHSYFDYFCEKTAMYKIEISNYVASAKCAVGLCFLSMDESYAKKNKEVEIVEINSSNKQDTSKNNEFVVVEEMPRFNNGGLELAGEYFQKNIQYPKIAKDRGIQGSVFVNFVVESNGKVNKVKIVRGVDPVLDQEAKRVVESMPDWTPGKQRGKNVPVQFTLPIVFNLNEKTQGTEKEQEVLTTTKEDKHEPFVVVEQMPKFDNKDVDAAKEYIAKNVKYPEVAVKNGIQGKVYVTFVVEKDGTLSETKIERGVDPILDNEAIRVIKSMPKWIPGKQRGKEVRVKIVLPVNFKLDK